ncbi:MAG: hypothetical protein K0U60_10020 [Actinomycetia bacterium]|nr:hypothetical protein [Actinomycetes bacterium]MCH9801306.1 hypothetical protein [Actinomycetes bacterium]
MGWARATGAIAAVTVASAMITSCEKPPPAVTVWSGSDSKYVPAQCWSFDDEPLDSRTCAEDILAGTRSDGLPTLPTQPGSTFGISVDPVVAEAGWQIRVSGQPVTTTPIYENYYRLPYATPPQTINLQIVAGGTSGTKGAWLVTLEPSTGS